MRNSTHEDAAGFVAETARNGRTEYQSSRDRLQYWSSQLENSKPAVIPCDRRRPAKLSGKVNLQRIDLDVGILRDLQRFCRSCNVTPLIALLSAFRSTQYRQTGSTDANIAVQTPIWNFKADQHGAANVRVGEGLTCLRIKLEDESFGDLVQQVANTYEQAQTYQYASVEEMSSELNIHGKGITKSLVRILFVFHPEKEATATDGGERMASNHETSSTNNFDLVFHCHYSESSLGVSIIYAQDLYGSASIMNLVTLFSKILSVCLESPSHPVASLDLFSARDRHQLVDMGLMSIQRTDYPRDSSIVDLFRQQVQLIGDRVAVKDSTTALTYGQLDTESDVVAQWIMERSLPKQSMIGIFSSRSCETIVAILGVLKANMAYLPLDTQTPPSRLNTILSSMPSKRLVLVGSDMLTPNVDIDVDFVPINAIPKPGADHIMDKQKLAKHSPAASSLAYVMFTSGSTGRPKGVMIEHRGVVRLAKNNNLTQSLPSHPQISHLSNIAFDAATWEIYTALLNGGTIICIDRMTVLDATAMTRTIKQHQVSSILLASALFKQYLRESPAFLSDLKLLLVGGDRVDPLDVLACRKIMSGTFVNAYGPTESTVIATLFTLGPGDDANLSDSVPIGRAISNSGAHVMDSSQRPVPVGTTGELVLTGDGLARGYTDPKRNVDKFVNVQIDGEMTRAYRTGDLVRCRPVDGELEFLGRIDSQVKVRGHRVEPGEVENVLLSHEKVNDAAVVLQEQGNGGELIGFIALSQAEISSAEGRAANGGRHIDSTAEHVGMWETAYDEDTYKTIDDIERSKIGRDFVGWTSMYDGSKINLDEMNEWLDDTITTINGTGEYRHVVEIGTGTGMVLFNLADSLQSYIGIEPSEKAVDFVRRAAKSIPAFSNKVRVRKGTAEDLIRLQESIQPGTMVIINSVTQHFPSQQYVSDLIDTIIYKLDNVSTIFFGDIRSQALFPQFQVTKAIKQLGENASQELIQQKMAEMAENELELLVDPAFFTSLVERYPELIRHVEVLPKRMRATNELSCYRYSAIIHIARPSHQRQPQVQHIQDEDWVDFSQRHHGRVSLDELLKGQTQNSIVAIYNIPNSKTAFESQVVKSVEKLSKRQDQLGDDTTWLSSLRKESLDFTSLAPIDVVEIAHKLGYSVEISCARQFSTQGAMDVIFHRQSHSASTRTLFNFPTDHAGRHLDSLTTHPGVQHMKQQVRDEVYDLMHAHLPPYMIPRIVTVLERLPLNDNGKVDRRALANRKRSRQPRVKGSLRKPASVAEQLMEQVWSKILNIDSAAIGLDDSFFQLGGTSITAMKVVSEARSVGLILSTVDIFQNPSLEAMAASATGNVGDTESIPPFSLLSDDMDVDIFLKDITARYDLSSGDIMDVYPCTALQEGLLSLTFKRPGNYICQSPLRIPAGIDVEKLQTAFEEVVQAIPTLRTRVVPYNSGLLQVVVNKPITWDRASSLEEYLKADRKLSIDFGQPLARYALITDSRSSSQWLVWTIHHALFDGWSMPLIMRSINQVYQGKTFDSGPPFTSFIKEILGQDESATASFWRDYLGNCESLATFPATNPSVQEPITDTVLEHPIQNPSLQDLDITVSSVIRGALALVLGQLTDSSDVLFGATQSGRHARVANIDKILGPTFATVPVHVQLDRQQSVRGYLDRVHRQATEMILFEQTGLSKISKMSSACQQACQFQTLLIVQAQGSSVEKQPDESIVFDWQPHNSNQEQWFNPYPLLLEVHLGSEQLLAKASFDSRIIQPDVVQALLHRLGHVMQQLSHASPNKALVEVELLSPTDLQKIWNGNASLPLPIERCLNDMITDQIVARPNAAAVCAWDGELTYLELDRLSNAVAHKIRAIGVQPETLVPLCFEKSMWTPVTMLGVLKAGGAFSMLDPSIPEQRLKNIVRQMGSEIILCSESKKDLSARLAKTALPISPKTLKGTADSPLSRPQGLSPSTAAIATFTSGSTGIPKGVVLTHSQYASLMVYQTSLIGFNPESRVFDFAAYAFDVAPHNAIASFANGACLCIPSEHDRQNNVTRSMADMRVTHANLTPSVARLIDPKAVPSLETLMLAGEASSQEDARRWWDTSVRLINGYGPAECPLSNLNVDITQPQDITSIGKPRGVATWVVDPQDHDRLLPPGCVGELCIEGPLLCRGYLNDPEKTAAAFIHDPKWLIKGGGSHPGRHGRLYKTGDLVKSKDDGSLVFIGRKDTQVKIRGQRVELAEIEHCLSGCMPETGLIVVEVVRVSGRPLLAAFFEGEDGTVDGEIPSSSGPLRQVPIPEEVQDHMLNILPRYMVPEAFFATPQLPYTLSRKIDRKQIRAMAESITLRQHNVAHVKRSQRRQPTTVDEGNMQRIWATVLGFEDPTHIGLDDSFFALGGNSIDAMKVVGEARKFGFEVTVGAIFQKPVMHQLIELVGDSNARAGKTSSIPRLQETGPVEQSFAQGRLWFIEQLHPGLSWYSMPIAVRLRGQLQIEALHAAIMALVQRHEPLRTTFFSEDGINKQRVHPFAETPLRIVDVPHGPDEGRFMNLLRKEQNTPFDLTRDPGWRICLYRLGEEDFVLSLVMHHIISDGWSVDLIRQELATLYSAATRGDRGSKLLESLDDLPIQYRDFAVWQRTQGAGQEYQRQLEYWVQQLELSRPAEFICDKHRPATLSGRARSQQLRIEGSVHESLQRFCRSNNLTTFTVLLAAFRAAHYRLTGVDDATFGCPNANRDLWELKNLVGFFVNLQCIRIPLQGSTSFKDLTRQVHATISDSFSNQDVPFETIVSNLQKERDLSRNPLAQVIFVLHSQQDLGQFQLQGTKTEAVAVDMTSRFDIEFHLFQEDNSLRGEVVYSEDLYDAATIRSISSTFQKILTSGLDNPTIEVASLPLWSSKDHAELSHLGLLSVEETDYPRNSSIVDCFKAQVEAHPARIGVQDAKTELSYSQLDKDSDHINDWLRAKRFREETLVGIFADRSCEAIVAMLGILKANLAYLPFDIKTPAGRMERILASVEGRKTVLVGSGVQLPRVRLDNVDFVLISDILKHRVNGYTNGLNDKDRPKSPTPDSLAHVMFTSGSTGQPKGVMIQHRGIVKLVKNTNFNHHRLDAVVAHITNLAFDISTWEIYVTLLNGGTLLCIDTNTILEHTMLPEIFHREAIRVIFFTPKLLEQYLAACPEVFSELEVFYTGGDYLEPTTLKAARKHMPGKIINVYGPAENSVVSTGYHVPQDERCVNGVPIGRAVSNCGVYVMDPEQRPVPLGVLGEMVVTGEGVARGYTDPERNQPFISIDIGGERVQAYRSGDCARYRPSDGLLEFICRMDRQVKIRGNRVELAEIEHTLRTHQAVSAAVVSLIETKKERDAQLAAFVSLENMSDEKLISTLELVGDDDGQQEQVKAWETMFDVDTYEGIESIETVNIGRDYSGWVSMYDGHKFPTPDMDEWLDDTMSLMLNGSHPGDVLELGTGTGMMLFNLAKGLKSYVGLDPSQKAVNFVQQSLLRFPDLASKTRVERGAATDFNRFRGSISPKLAVVNSVAQYFPSQQYILQLIEGLLELGSIQTIFFGDIRSLPLHRQFQVTKAMYTLGRGDVGPDALRQEMERIEQAESEFLISPEFFTSLQDLGQFSQLIDHVEVLPKRMKATNELSCYRYAAVIHAKQKDQRRHVRTIHEDEWIDFTERSITRESLAQTLQSITNEGFDEPVVAVSNIPYAKTISERYTVASLDARENDPFAGRDDWLTCLRQAAAASPSLSAKDLADLAHEAGYRVEISWARQSSQYGGMDAIFHKFQPEGDKERVLFKFPTDHHGKPTQNMTNQPLLQQMKQKIVTQLRSLLESQLPPYMIPDSIAVLPKLPLNANGKIDRAALTDHFMKSNGPVVQKSLRHPTSESEHKMRDVWADVLGRQSQSIGLDDNFFLLGGNSITAMKLVSRARSAGLQFAVADIFRFPTLVQLAGLPSLLVLQDIPREPIEPFSLMLQAPDRQTLRNVLSEQLQVPSKNVIDAYPCTPLQEGLISLTSKRPGDYIMQVVFDVPADISMNAFKLAWAKVSEALPILRTRVVKDPTHGLVQVVLDQPIEWREARNVKEYLQSDIESPMGIGTSLVRFALISNETGTATQCVWTMHHAIYDGWSFGLIMKAFRQAYSGGPVTPGTPYPRFIKYIQDQNKEASKQYWHQQLDSFEGITFPSITRNKEQPLSDKMIKSTFETGHERVSGITTAILLRAAWALIAGQFTSSNDTVFGVTISGRNSPVPGIEEMAAPTFATVPVRVRWDRHMTIPQYLQMVLQQATDMIPFEQAGLHHIAPLSQGCQQACAFQTLLVIQTGFEKGTSGALKLREGDGQQQKRFNPYALMLEVEVEQSTVTTRATFDSTIIDETTVIRSLHRLSCVMQQLEKGTATQRIADLQVMSSEDSQEIWDWNRHCPKPVNKCVHDLISDQATAHPDAQAIQAWNGSLTYQQLDSLSCTFAETLRKAGIGSGCLVPLCFEKSMLTSVAMLSVLKTGAAFILLDVLLPEERLRGMVQQTKSRLVVSSALQNDLACRLAEQTIILGPEVIAVNSEVQNTPSHKRLSRTNVEPSSLMCVVFTSGSTGKPKGAMLSHANIASGVTYQKEQLEGFTKSSRVFDFASYAFDIAIHNMVATFITGGCLCVPSEEQRKDGLVETMAAMRVTTANLTPSVARLIDPVKVPDLEVLILAGEAVTAKDAARWVNGTSPACVVNAYGPAECGISTINHDQRTAEHLTSIGKGAGVVTWVVDPQDHTKLVAPGCPGELLLQGPLVGMGYLNEPEKTREAFVERPSTWLSHGEYDASGCQGRLYKTGDLVQYDGEGNLIFIGRKDTQVKVRGQRVELGEVEHVVQECIPFAADVVAEVVGAEDKEENCGPVLVAFVKPSHDSRAGAVLERLTMPPEADNRLRSLLPSYMIPSLFLSVQDLPLTVTRKVDRTKLRELATTFLAKEGIVNGLSAVEDAHNNSASDDVIWETEQPAYSLASMACSLRQSWSRDPIRVADNGQSSENPTTATSRRTNGYRNATLQSCGLDSISMMSLKYNILQNYNVVVGMHVLLNRDTTFRVLAKLVNKGQENNAEENALEQASLQFLDLYDEITRHDQAIVTATNGPGTFPSSRERRVVFLTGASGFIGTQILRQILLSPRVERVIALARGDNAESAQDRVVSAARKAQWWNESYMRKLVVWNGDLSKQNLGLVNEQQQSLRDDVDTVIHNGAVVHWGKSYHDLEAANVDSTAYLLQVVSKAAPNTNFVYVTGGQSSIYEDGQEKSTAESLSDVGIIGYTQTKFVAEALTRRSAQRHPGRFAVVSPGLVVGTPTEGVANADDYLWRLAAACIRAGVYDGETTDQWFDVADAARVSHTVMDVALNLNTSRAETGSRHRGVTPVGGGMTWGQFWEILRSMGYVIEAKSAQEWLQTMLLDLDREREKHPLWPVAHMIQGEGEVTEREDAVPRNGVNGNAKRLEEDGDIKKAVVKNAEFLARLGHLPRVGKRPLADDMENQKEEAFMRSGL